MLVMCKGNCGKVYTRQPYKSTRVVEFLCEQCQPKYATKVVKTVVKRSSIHASISRTFIKREAS